VFLFASFLSKIIYIFFFYNHLTRHLHASPFTL
jgi:hypothetical protein